jgi:hypothetical protein
VPHGWRGHVHRVQRGHPHVLHRQLASLNDVLVGLDGAARFGDEEFLARSGA